MSAQREHLRCCGGASHPGASANYGLESMKKLFSEHHPPLARKAEIFLNTAKLVDKIDGGSNDFEEATYYLLSQAVELSIKALVKIETGQTPPRTHDKQELAERYREVCRFSDDEMDTITRLKQLNNGPGGLRYDNQPIGQFSPKIFKHGIKIVERLLEKFE